MGDPHPLTPKPSIKRHGSASETWPISAIKPEFPGVVLRVANGGLPGCTLVVGVTVEFASPRDCEGLNFAKTTPIPTMAVTAVRE